MVGTGRVVWWGQSCRGRVIYLHEKLYFGFYFCNDDHHTKIWGEDSIDRVLFKSNYFQSLFGVSLFRNGPTDYKFNFCVISIVAVVIRFE